MVLCYQPRGPLLFRMPLLWELIYITCFSRKISIFTRYTNLLYENLVASCALLIINVSFVRYINSSNEPI